MKFLFLIILSVFFTNAFSQNTERYNYTLSDDTSDINAAVEIYPALQGSKAQSIFYLVAFNSAERKNSPDEPGNFADLDPAKTSLVKINFSLNIDSFTVENYRSLSDKIIGRIMPDIIKK